MIDIENGLKGMVIHHKSLTNAQMKRLLLTFDEVVISPPDDNEYFLEKGAICYYYEETETGTKIFSSDGFQMLDNFRETPRPEIPSGSLPIWNVLSYGGDKAAGANPYTAVILDNYLPLYNAELNKKNTYKLLEVFTKAFNKDYISVLKFDKRTFYKNNGIAIKIAHDFDLVDVNCFNSLKDLIQTNSNVKTKDGLYKASWFEKGNLSVFPTPVKTNESFFSNYDSRFKASNQYSSIVGKINKSLALCNEHNLAPIFIDNHIHQYFTYKTFLAKNTKDSIFKQKYNEVHDKSLENLANFSMTTANQFLSDKQLNEIPLYLLLNYRERSLNDLYKYRLEISNVINSITNNDFDRVNSIEIQNWLTKEVMPKFLKYTEKQNGLLSKVLNFTIKSGVGAGTTALGFSEGLSPALISVLSGAMPQIADELITFKGRLDASRRQKFLNTFSYFINATKITS